MGEYLQCMSNTLKKLWPQVGKLATVSANNPFQNMSIYILTNLPVSERGNRSIILFTNYYSKWVKAFAMENEKAITGNFIE